MTGLIWIAAVALVLAGLAGTVLPALPGPILVLAGLVLAASADGFVRVGWPSLILLTLLTAAAYVVDLAATAFGVRRFGASRRAAVGAALGTIVGLFFGLPGLIIGPITGAILGEVWARRKIEGAGRAVAGASVGFLLGAIVKLAVVFTMVGLFLAALFLV